MTLNNRITATKLNLIDLIISHDVPDCRVYIFTTDWFKWIFYLYSDNYLDVSVQVDGLLYSDLNKARNLLTGQSLNEFNKQLKELKRAFSHNEK